MKHLPAVFLVLMAFGCGDETPVAPAPEEAPPADEAPVTSLEGNLQMQSTEFYLYDVRPLAGVAKKPLMTIEAEELDLSTQEGNRVSFKKARAVVRSADPNEPDIVFHAEEGSFIENEQAHLKGGVVAQVGDMTVQLQDILMNSPAADASLFAESTHPVQILGPGISLEAQSVRLYPDEKSFELTNGTGHIDFGRFQP